MKRWDVPLLAGALATIVGAGPRYGVQAYSGAAHHHVMSVRSVQVLCKRSRKPLGTRSVRGYFLSVPINAGIGGETGALFDKQVLFDAAFKVPPPATPGTQPRMLQVKVAKGGLVILVPQAKRQVATETWVIVRGVVSCGGLDQQEPAFIGGKKQPWMEESSWQPAPSKHTAG